MSRTVAFAAFGVEFSITVSRRLAVRPKGCPNTPHSPESIGVAVMVARPVYRGWIWTACANRYHVRADFMNAR
jgi:hypothetical protein